MGGSSAPSRTTQTTEPPQFIQPFLKYGAEQAQRLYQGGGPAYFPESTVVPFSAQTQQALNLTQQRALNGSPVVDAAQNYAQRTLSSTPMSGFGSAMNPYASGSSGFGGQQNPYAAAVQQFGGMANPFASGPSPYRGATPFDGGGNPYLDATFNRAADQVQNRLQSSFASAGRNIGAARAPAALELNDLANQVYGGAYDADRNRQLQAYEGQQGRDFAFRQLGANAFDAERGRGLTELQQLRDIGSSGYEAERNRVFQDLQQRLGIGATGFENAQNRALDDLQQQRGLQFSAAGLAPGLAQQDYTDLAALQGVGGQYEALQRDYLDDAINRFNFDQNRPQMNLDNYLARIVGSFPGGTQTAITPNTRNRSAGFLGGAATGAASGASTGVGIIPGAIIGGLLGAYG